MVYIKQIIIQGFKSYKDQTVIEPFSPKHNVIVGRNGSGKSNFFAAIRFVLSDAYTSMGREERQALLHEGSGSAVMSAYVEIIFDNGDERFPTGKDELILRRTIGAKKDEYSLDRKNATRTDVNNLLESAGFSKSNPYYIVPQGRVTTLTNMKDPERLTLLKEISGTHVYEDRRAVSIRIMAETDSKKTQIDEALSSIHERLDELEEEKEELNAYQAKDKERRCLEYTIYHREQEELSRALESLEGQRLEGVDETDNNRDRFMQGERALSKIDGEIKILKQRVELLMVDKRQYEDERRDVARERANVELLVKGITDGQSAAQNARARHDNELQEVQAGLKQRQQQLSQIMPKYIKARDQEKAIKAQLDDADATQKRLFAKQGRSAKFKSKNERDTWLKNEIDEVNIALATRKAVAMQTTEEIQILEKDIEKMNAEIDDIRKRLDNRSSDMQSVEANVRKAKESKERLDDQRKEMWREQARLDTVLRDARQELDSSERSLSHMMNHNTSRGLANVRRIKQTQKLNGAYGTLAELFEVPERYKTAVEVTAGESLFHYVVDTEETASRIVDILTKEKAGRVTFMPLNRLRPKPANMPKANDAIEMISRLDYDPMFEKAFQQVFGKTIICPNLQIAAQYARSHGVTAITPEGDRSDKKGALTGGYHDPRSSRLDAVKRVAKTREGFEANRTRGDDISHELERKEQEITRAYSDLQKTDQRRRQTEESFGPLAQESRRRTADLQNKQDTLESKKRAKDNVDATTRDLTEQQSAFEAELATDFKKALTQEEEQRLETVGASLPSLRKKHLELSSSRAELEAQKSTIDVELRENLQPRLDQLTNQEMDTDSAGGSPKLEERQSELKKITESVEVVEKKLRDVEQNIEAVNAELNEMKESRSAKHREQEEVAKAIEKSQKRSEKGIAKRSILAEKAAEANRNIRDLGALPEEAFTKYAKMPSDQAIKKLRSVNEALKQYSHVNKKAFEQYSNFTRQRDQLTKRRKELGDSQSSIRDLIEHLDQRKDEAIERTFKQVSKEFAGIFSRLVPAGRGRLIIQRKSDAQGQAALSESDNESGRDSGVENYTGVGIAVSFNSKHDEQQRIQQLSGGQKSLCALALVFAIQRCDPAPFYLFDEIDANLDAQYRTAVADLLRHISEKGQFICTTFRPEMVHVAEKCYGVTYSGNKTSRIDVVERQDALGFIEGQISGA